MRLKNCVLFSLLNLCACLHAYGGEVSSDSIKIAIAPEYDQVSKSHRFWFGENYRKLCAAKVNIRIVDLQKEHGGLVVERTGGGMQTRSLRLKDAAGREWVLRTVQKYPERGLPQGLRPTVAKDILQDQVSTGHPYASLIVPPLAEALGLPHANPEIVYVTDDPALGEYRKDFANAVYLLEERVPREAADTDNSEKVRKEVSDDNDIRIEQKLVLRARVLDMLIGDWDRHEDNWRWLDEKGKDGKIYSPVPRDRDKVFYKTSGVFPWILSHQWLKSNLQPYSETVRDIRGWNYNARYFDRFFLNRLEWRDWQDEIAFVQRTITDELAEKAMKEMPPAIYQLGGEETLRILKERRNKLESFVAEYYRFLSETVDIPLSEKREFVDVEYLQGGDVKVTVNNRKKDGSRGRLLFARTFDAQVTKEIRLYGLAGEDVYTVKGTARSGIVVRLVGGRDQDVFSADSNLANKKRLYIYDNLDGKNSVPLSSLAKLRLSADSAVNLYEYKSFKYDRLGPMALINYNIDQGIQLRAGFLYEKQGFRKEPYAVKHEFWANYSTGRNSYIFNYEGIFKDIWGKNDLNIDFSSLGPNNLTNFFGIGNETQFLRDEPWGIGYYRNRLDYLTANIRLDRQVAPFLRMNFGLGAEFYTSARDNNTTRFLNAYASTQEAGVYTDKLYAGIVAGLRYDSRDTESMPSKGVFWNTELTAKRDLTGVAGSYARVSSELALYIPLSDSSIVLAGRLGGGTTLGSPQFFQQMQLGGVRSLRGFHTNRFTGKSMVYNNVDVRVKLFHFTSYLFPGTVGVLGFHDVGRVWVPSEASDKWHNGYGGGIYVVPADLILIQASVGFSREGSLPYISIGFTF